MNNKPENKLHAIFYYVDTKEVIEMGDYPNNKEIYDRLMTLILSTLKIVSVIV